MTKLHRKDLKQDEVKEKLSEAVKSVTLHTREVIYIITIVIAVGAIAAFWSYYEKNQQQQSQAALGTAIRKFQSQVGEVPPETPVKPEFNFKTDAEKYRASLKDFEQIIQRYGNTPAAETARYYAGVSAFYLADNKKAEDYLKQSTRVTERNILFYVSRMALANFYSVNGRHDEAAKQINEAIQKNRSIVPQENLLLQLADIYEKAGKSKEARDTWQKIVDEYKETPASFQAQTHLNDLKAK